MKIRIISVGKKHTKNLQAAIKDYEQRIVSKYSFEWLLVNPSDGDVGRQVDEESQKILRLLKSNDYVVLLDETGTIVTNQGLADIFNKVISDGKYSSIVFIVGGAYGVNVAVKERANFIWSLSKLVFPHQLVRLILVEQLYRTNAILDNHPYHHQ